LTSTLAPRIAAHVRSATPPRARAFGPRAQWAMPVRRDSARPNNPTAVGGIAGRFAGRFASADQPRGTRAAASVPGLAELRQELDVHQLVLPWAHVHANPGATVERALTQWPASPTPFATVGPCAPRVWSASLGGAREAHQRRPRQAWGVAARGIEGNSRQEWRELHMLRRVSFVAG